MNSLELVVNLSKTSLLEGMVKQKRSRQKDVQPSLTTIKKNGEEKIIYPEQYIILLGTNIEQNLSWNAHLIHGDKAVLPTCRQQLGSLRHISKQIPIKKQTCTWPIA